MGLVGNIAARLGIGKATLEQSRQWCNGSDSTPDQRISGCTALIQSGTETQQSLAAAFYNRGNAHYAKGDYDHAITNYSEAIRLDPNDHSAYDNRGSAYSHKGDLDRAIADYERAMRINPQDIKPIYNRGNLYKKKGDFDRALADYNHVISARSKIRVDLHQPRQHLQGKRRNTILRSPIINEAIGLNQNNAVTFNNRGTAYYLKQNYDRAIADYDQAIAIDPKYPIPYYGRSLARRQRGDTAGADADAAHAKGLDPSLFK